VLVLTRRLNEKIVIPGIHTSIQVVGIRSGAVRLGIAGPPDVTVLREELSDRITAREEVPEPESIWRGLAPEDERLLGKRLDLACQGLALMRRQLRAGLEGEAEATLDQVEDELHSLVQRLRINPQATPESRQPRRALLVEDNANERELLAMLLRRSGMVVDTAADGEDALAYLHTHRLPNVMLLDMGLPRRDGASVVRAVREDPACAGLRIFAVSGHQPNEFNLAPGPAGIDRWFQKPLDPAALVHDLNEEPY
jgi:carbon storage regulator CsrA